MTRPKPMINRKVVDRKKAEYIVSQVLALVESAGLITGAPGRRRLNLPLIHDRKKGEIIDCRDHMTDWVEKVIKSK